MINKEDDLSIRSIQETDVRIETINRGKTCFYKNEQYFIVYETIDFKLISKNKDLSKSFSVKPKEVTYV